ncbi:MAG: CDP-diacylglycerol--glycerol-3-phosphate 3-phosphatidyltransferase [Thermodesulfobacteriota bacterium]
MFNMANNLTLARMGSIPLIVFLLYFPNRVTALMAMLIFIAASLTDLADGIIARKYNLITNMGKFLDPLADKLLIAAVLVMLVQLSWLQGWIAVVIISREIMVTGLRSIAAEKGLVIAADKYGKIKTIIQCVALCPLILHYPWWGFDPRRAGTILIYAALILTVLSGANYLAAFYRRVLAG